MFATFQTWDEVLSHARQFQPLFYQAPLDLKPVRVSPMRVYKNGRVKLAGPYGTDPFTADAGHLERFRRPAIGSPRSMSFGVMPPREDFEAAFDRECPDGTFSFGNDPYVGTCELTSSELWAELEAQKAAHDAGEHASDCAGDGSCSGDGCPCEEAGSWCSSVLGILGFEWI